MPNAIDSYDSRRSTVYGTGGVVATSQPLAAEAGLHQLRDGGNAFDAAVTTAAVLSVVEPFSTGIGGDVFALYRTADGKVGGMRSCGRAPVDTDLLSLREQFCGEDPTIPEFGPHSVTAPGTALGWEATIDRFGTRSFDEVLQPAIEYARDGFPVTEVIASQWATGAKNFRGENARDQFLIDGHSPEAGELMELSELAETLELLGEDGSDAVMDGPVGEAIIEEVSSRGGTMSQADLDNIEVEWLEPISTTYNGAEVYELPPNNQGLIALEALNIAEELDAGSHPYLSASGVHRYVEALKVAYRDGHHYITDPSREDVPALASKGYASTRADTITETAREDVEIGRPGTDASADSDTVLLTVADGEGNVVSYINSLFQLFGSGIVAGDTGVVLQNRGSSFSLNPDHPNRFEPGKKPFHTLIPGLVRFDEDDWAAFGVMGGFMQPQGHLQVLSALIDHDLTLQQAMDAPRWYYRETGRLSVESRLDDVLQTRLARRGHDVDIDIPDLFGGGQIARNADGVLSAATDPRKDGAAVSF